MCPSGSKNLVEILDNHTRGFFVHLIRRDAKFRMDQIPLLANLVSHVRLLHPTRPLQILNLVDVVDKGRGFHPAALPVPHHILFHKVVNVLDFGNPVDKNRLKNGTGKNDCRLISAVRKTSI